MTNSSENEICYRCTVCKKYSHAKRKPSRHERLVEGAIPEGAVVLRREPAVYDHLNGFIAEERVYIACGPFETRLTVLIPEVRR